MNVQFYKEKKKLYHLSRETLKTDGMSEFNTLQSIGCETKSLHFLTYMSQHIRNREEYFMSNI